MSNTSYGIASLGVQLPPLFMSAANLAVMRNVDPNKYTKGLGCGDMALCPEGYDAVALGVGAAKRALSRWGGSLDDIGMVAVGTESAKDMSRPLSAWIAQELGLSGNVRSYEVKHACYGGTLALRQAYEWKASGSAAGRAALVIASDVALYSVGDPGEPTQGAGAVAMIVDTPDIAALSPVSFPYSDPAFDFWRPVGDAFPTVDGPLSLSCYKQAALQCFQALIGERSPASALRDYEALCFHVPFPKMVKKAVMYLGEEFGFTAEETEKLFNEKVEPTLEWNRLCGNAYTAALWISVARALGGLQEGKRITAFSYGSGYGAELFELVAGPQAAAFKWRADVDADLQSRQPLDSAGYKELRSGAPAR